VDSDEIVIFAHLFGELNAKKPPPKGGFFVAT
jgi:hypothetical protein